MIQNEQHKKAIQIALSELRENPAYLIIAENLKNKRENYENLIFDESKYNDSSKYNSEKKYSQIDLMVIKRNLIKAFIELPDDLLNLFD